MAALKRLRQKPQGTVGAGFTNFVRTARTIFGPSSKPPAPRRAKPALKSRKPQLPVRGKAPPSRPRFKPPNARSR